MTEPNPLLDALRQILTTARRELDRHVQLVRADPESPAEPAAGWVLHVGRHRIDLAPPPPPVADTGWQPLALEGGLTGAASYRVRDGVLHLRGLVTHTAGNFGSSYVTLATLPESLWPDTIRYGTSQTHTHGNTAVLAVTTAGLIRAASTTTDRVALESLTPYPVAE